MHGQSMTVPHFWQGPPVPVGNFAPTYASNLVTEWADWMHGTAAVLLGELMTTLQKII